MPTVPFRIPRPSCPSRSFWGARYFLALHFAVLFVALSLSVALPASIAGIVGYWSFDEGGGLTTNDNAGNGNTGLLVNEPQWTTGRFGAGLLFDGIDDYVEVPHSDSLNLTRELTVSAWIYNKATHEPLLQQSEYHVIAAKGWAPDRGGSWTLAWDRKTDSLFFCARKNTNNGVKCTSFDFGSLTDDWHLITAVFNDGKLRLYVDGLLAAGPVNLGTAKINSNTENLHIGGLPSSGSNSNDSWHGFIDEVQISDVALSEAEVATISGVNAARQNFDFSLIRPGDLSVGQASIAVTNLRTALLSGTSKFVSFSVSGLPSNVSASFSVTSCSPSCSTALTIKTASNSRPGTYPVTLTARAGTLQRRTTFNLVIVPMPSFDFALSNSGDKSVTIGSSVTNSIAATLTSGTSQSITFSASGLPSGVSASFFNAFCSPSCSSTLSLSTSSSAPGGTYPIIVTATGGGVSKTTTFNLAVNLPGVATPTITPNGGTYTGSVSVGLQSATSGASIYYTTNGATPTESSTLYSAPFTLNSSASVKAKAFKNGYSPSAEASASLTVTQPFDFSLANSGAVSVAAGSSVSNNITATLSSGSTQPVTFSVSGLPSGSLESFSSTSCSPTCSTVLNITTGGLTPAGNFPITVTSSGGGVTRTTAFTLSVTVSVSFVVATPTITPNGGTFSGSASVTMATATSGASIYYTTDGSTPTQSSTPYSGAMTLMASAMVKAKAFRINYNPSAEASASFSIATTGTSGSIYYISPSGSDSGSGTSASSPWKTFAFAVTKLRPGDQLVLLNGTYTMGSNGRIYIRCDASGWAQNGTAAYPITVRAQNERQAFLNGDGSASTIQVYSCSYWNFEGLRANSADHASGGGGVVGIAYSHHLVFRKMLFQYNNRYGNTHLISATLGSNIVIEENEFYETHRGGIVGSFDNSIIRRNYFNARSYPDILGGYTSISAKKGDESVAIYPGSNNIVENNISEGSATGFTIQALGVSDNNKFLGNVSLSEEYAFGAKVRVSGTDSWSPRNTLFENSVAVNPGIGMYNRGTFNTIVNNVSIIAGTNIGIIADIEAGSPGGGVYSLYSANTLLSANQSYGFVMKHDFLLDYSNAFGSVTNFSPEGTDPRITNERSVDPQLGSCKVYIPSNSPMKGAGKNGGDIGANVLYRYENGNLTNQPLWNPVTGEFPHGVIVSGVNDIAGSSAFDVHKRLNVNANGCSLPAGYGG